MEVKEELWIARSSQRHGIDRDLKTSRGSRRPGKRDGGEGYGPLSHRKPKKKETVERGRRNEGRRGDGEEVGYTLKFARQTELFVFLSTQNYLLGICLGDTRGT